ncbi:MAG TPA: trehalose-phosphatase, partial [Anaerolineales bacterium]|nr:trehalose-phosphatase [Anaerolineales bacterium]
MTFKGKDELTDWAMGSPCLWLFLDYDGTLAEFAPTPEHIEPNQEIIDVLEQLVQRPCTRVTILSGRRLEHVRQLLPVPGLFLAGTYGLEFMDPTGAAIRRVEYKDIRPVLETIKPQWQQLIEGRNGFFLEDKGWTLALHARFADDQEAEQVLTHARRLTRQVSPASRFRILGGHKFLEIAPRRASKRDTVAYLLSRYPLPEARLLYIGDDDKDEEAFPLIHANQGLAVKVLQPTQAGQPTAADFCFQSTGET